MPIQFGNLGRVAGHPQLRDACSAQFADKQASATSCSPRRARRSTTPQFPEAAAEDPVEWVDKGYFNKNFNGIDYDPAWQAFAKGEGRYLIAGTWVTADLAKEMGATTSASC